MIALLEDPSIDETRLKRGYAAISTDLRFAKLIRGATTDTLNVRERIRLAKRILGNG